ncbi:hypothetical protein [Pseudogemmobacter sp. W21_MBD1_M6]|uniref:hypothetical protein n=1 Tax=Pseudogemmobacter sp. W21_MBD1_M6 TaxID=3240271 RepID=UPI003F9AB598
MANLSPELGARLGRLLSRLESDSPGEVVATVAAIRRTLDQAGLDLHDLAARLTEPPREAHPKPNTPDDGADLLALAHWLRLHAFTRLTLRHREFVNNVSHLLTNGNPLTPKQVKWLRDLYTVQKGH